MTVRWYIYIYLFLVWAGAFWVCVTIGQTHKEMHVILFYSCLSLLLKHTVMTQHLLYHLMQWSCPLCVCSEQQGFSCDADYRWLRMPSAVNVVMSGKSRSVFIVLLAVSRCRGWQDVNDVYYWLLNVWLSRCFWWEGLNERCVSVCRCPCWIAH